MPRTVVPPVGVGPGPFQSGHSQQSALRDLFFQLGECAKINAGTVWHRRFTSFGRLSSAQNLSFTGEKFPPGCAVSFVNRRLGMGSGVDGSCACDTL